jgi:hypothetical protein
MLDLGYAIVKREKINKPILKEKNRRSVCSNSSMRYYAKFL